MKRFLLLAAIVLMSVCLISAVNAQPIDKSSKVKAGIDWYEKVMRERAIRERAAEERNAMKKAAKNGDDSYIAGLTVDAYNDYILKKNAKKAK